MRPCDRDVVARLRQLADRVAPEFESELSEMSEKAVWELSHALQSIEQKLSRERRGSRVGMMR